ncbi:prepilin-type N-terminal cleavage/methylation domain-containing protein [Pseudomonas huaxiensis]|uniref:prepilin-type N-terminal cleavage/methylation domain-containing protein n=1 Tax=Pseudomonas huaxiensis TaxID=2213017 RepID=UPI000DA6667E|nr:prepilin-type N-terminal cleavage/methylation domain-containing protein [Pseudomonas huaxiensis]
MRRMQGFTLLELLASISLMGLLMVLVAGAYKSSAGALGNAMAASQRMGQERAAKLFLRKAIEGLYPSGGFMGEPDRAEFIAPLPMGLGGQPRRHRLEVTAVGKAGLELRVTFLASDREVLWGDPQVLISGLRDLGLSYRGFDDMRRDSGWLDHWPWPQRAPRLVRLQMRNAQGQWSTTSLMVRGNQQTGIGK